MTTNGTGKPGDTDAARAAAQGSIQAERSAIEAEQAAADRDQTSSDADQTAAERDEADAARDQQSSDDDQASADQDTHPDGAALKARDASRVARETTRLRRLATHADRAETARIRAKTAGERDAMAAERDEAARRMDARAQAVERSIADSEAPLARRLEQLRTRAAADRARAAADRERAAQDRAIAAEERSRLEAELHHAHLDDLTGAFRREMGTLALSHEIDRARRGDGRFVIAFVDVDGMKAVNDRDGHAAGDHVLQTLVSTMRSNLRSFDPIVRYGGDEFLAGLGGADLKDVGHRFERIERAVKETVGVGISVGLASLTSDESLDELTARADALLLEAKKARGQ